jgi:hypothetical protein
MYCVCHKPQLAKNKALNDVVPATCFFSSGQDPLELTLGDWALGSSDFDKIFENCFASCSFGLAKDISDYFRKGIFLNFLVFLSFFGFCVDKF